MRSNNCIFISSLPGCKRKNLLLFLPLKLQLILQLIPLQHVIILRFKIINFIVVGQTALPVGPANVMNLSIINIAVALPRAILTSSTAATQFPAYP